MVCKNMNMNNKILPIKMTFICNIDIPYKHTHNIFFISCIPTLYLIRRCGEFH